MKRAQKRALDLSVPPFSRKFKDESISDTPEGSKWVKNIIQDRFLTHVGPKFSDYFPTGVYQFYWREKKKHTRNGIPRMGPTPQWWGPTYQPNPRTWKNKPKNAKNRGII